MPFFKRSLAGPGYIVLNVIRVLNLITLTAVAAASFAMLVKTFNISKFFFFDGVSHLITGILSLALVITEIGLFRRYTTTNWPLLSPSSGFVTLGVLMIIIGVSTLGNLNKTATSEKSLGHSAWSLVIAAGILVSVLGFVNIAASYAFRQKALDISARQVRAHGSTAPQKVDPYMTPPMTSRSNTMKSRRSFMLNRNRRTMSETLPRYNSQAGAAPSNRNISNPLPVVGKSEKFGGEEHEEGPSPQTPEPPPMVNGIQRPDLALHPAYQNRSF
ncbi:hypothetical protein ACLMJK_007120 [Lecanora helva]